MNEEKILKIGDKYARVFIKDGAIAVQAIEDPKQVTDLIAEATVLKGEDPDVSVLQKVFDDLQKEMLDNLKIGMKKTILRGLGFSDSWGKGWEIDHCNGRMSQVTDLIKLKIKDLIGEVTPEDLGLSEKERKELVKAMKKDMLEEYRRQLRGGIYERVKSIIQEDTERVAQDILRERNSEIANALLNKLFKTTK